MDSVAQNRKQNKRYLPHEVTTRINAVKMYRSTGDLHFVLRRYHVSKASLMRWNKLYDGTKESLADKSHRPHAPDMIQTDNGSEFTHTRKTSRIHPLDALCNRLHIVHKTIRPATPWHNGKVERSHRSDQERFYNYLSFYSYEDLQLQMNGYKCVSLGICFFMCKIRAFRFPFVKILPFRETATCRTSPVGRMVPTGEFIT